MLELKNNYELVPLISRPEYGPKCIKLLNEVKNISLIIV